MSSIPAILAENAKKWPDRDVLIASRSGKDRSVTFFELEATVESFARTLIRRGINPGDPVLVFVPMSIELYVALLALFRIGATAVFIDPSSGLRHIEACCSKVPPAALIAVWPMRILRWFSGNLRKIPRVLPPPNLGSDTNKQSLPDYPEPDVPALITFTSGSTGQPKAAVRTHRFLIAQYEALKSSILLEPGERDLTTLPVFVLANLAAGITSILPDAKISRPGSVNASRIESQAARLRPNRTGGSPAFYHRLLSTPASLTSFRKIYTGGAPVFPAFLQALQAQVPHAEVVAVFGSTEAEPIAHIACREISSGDWQAMRDGRGLLTGKPIAEIRLRIIADQWGKAVTNTAPLGPMETGEIVVSGGHVLPGYLNGEGDSETKFRIDGDIWHRTGDAGYLDPRDRLWLLGRCSAKVSDAHGDLYPFAVECVAMSFPFVRRCAFVLHGGKRLLAIEGDLPNTDSLRQSLAWAKLDEIREMRTIPVDARHNAKVNYPKLRKSLGKQLS